MAEDDRRAIQLVEGSAQNFRIVRQRLERQVRSYGDDAELVEQRPDRVETPRTVERAMHQDNGWVCTNR